MGSCQKVKCACGDVEDERDATSCQQCADVRVSLQEQRNVRTLCVSRSNVLFVKLPFCVLDRGLLLRAIYGQYSTQYPMPVTPPAPRPPPPPWTPRPRRRPLESLEYTSADELGCRSRSPPALTPHAERNAANTQHRVRSMGLTRRTDNTTASSRLSPMIKLVGVALLPPIPRAAGLDRVARGIELMDPHISPAAASLPLGLQIGLDADRA